MEASIAASSSLCTTTPPCVSTSLPVPSPTPSPPPFLQVRTESALQAAREQSAAQEAALARLVQDSARLREAAAAATTECAALRQAAHERDVEAEAKQAECASLEAALGQVRAGAHQHGGARLARALRRVWAR